MTEPTQHAGNGRHPDVESGFICEVCGYPGKWLQEELARVHALLLNRSICPVCGEAFKPIRGVYCSRSCQVAGYNERRKANGWRALGGEQSEGDELPDEVIVALEVLPESEA